MERRVDQKQTNSQIGGCLTDSKPLFLAAGKYYKTTSKGELRKTNRNLNWGQQNIST